MQLGKRCHSLRGLAAPLLCVALLCGWAALYPAVSEEQDSPEAVDRRHEALAGPSCIECHAESISSKGSCLLYGDRMCVTCHEIPEKGGGAGLAEPSAPLCFKCHAQDGFNGDYVHGPVAAGACITCHSPHGGSDSTMVRIEGRQMCLTCHEDIETDLANARYRHPTSAGGCTGCHSPHVSEYRYQLRELAPGVCSDCHENIFDNLETAAVTHSPVREELACMNCHSPHVSEYDGLLLSDEMEICLQCHDEPIEVGQYELELMGRLLSANPNHHGPVLFGQCSECHNPHSSTYFRLLTDAYPERQYMPFFESNYVLCFRCHEPALVKEERSDSLTEFRDGDHNLHFVHVNKTSMGRTCRLCHDPHASSQSGHVRESVLFGTWDMPIEFKQTENGGSCAPGCHAEKSYDRQASPPAGP